MISTQVSDAKKVLCGQENTFLLSGYCLPLLWFLPDESVQLIVTSPPYNLGKEYETKDELDTYLGFQDEIISECVRVLKPSGSICWQVGNYIVDKGHILPLDIVLHSLFAAKKMQLRNRIIWHFEHGLHCKKRFYGRYEVIMWYTKTDDYTFSLDPIRVPQKYPSKKHFKGPNRGKLSGNLLGKNPSDVWIFPNVKHNHCEKTDHPCQFPVELVDRLILSLTGENDVVLDPFAGSSTSLISAFMNRRRSLGQSVCGNM